MKIVFLDANTIGNDIDLSKFNKLGEFVVYGFSNHEDITQRVKDADVIITNKMQINKDTIGQATNLKLVCVTATGVDNLDLPYLDERGIAYRNVAGYSTDSVAQHTFAMLFYLLQSLSYYDDYVKSGKYVNDSCFTHFDRKFHQLNGLTYGIIGLGAIGRKVAGIATAFGAKVIYYSPSKKEPQKGYTQVDLDTLLTDSDIISLHSPLNEFTKGIINKNTLKKMKNTGILLNLARGGLMVEKDLLWALEQAEIKAAGLDVLSFEPMKEDNPLRKIQDSTKLLITPHIGWASYESRKLLMDSVYENIEKFNKN